MTEKKTRFSSVFNRTPLEPEPTAPEKITRMGRPPGKKSNPEYTQVTVYLRKEVHQAARKLLIDEQKQFSDLVGDLVARWILERQMSGSL